MERPLDLPDWNHYPCTNFVQLKDEYAWLWQEAEVSGWAATDLFPAVTVANKMRSHFECVPDLPWELLAAITHMECNLTTGWWQKTILNGEPIGRVTQKYPAGHGPWKSWPEAAQYAMADFCHRWAFELKDMRWDKISNWLFFAECWNGFGYRREAGVNMVPRYASPYLYSGTQFYERGKYVEKLVDGKYHAVIDPTIVSQQVGIVAFLKGLGVK